MPDPPRHPVGQRVRAFWPGGRGLKKGWHLATVKEFHTNAKRFKYLVTWLSDGKDSSRTPLQLAPEHEDRAGATKTLPLELTGADHRHLIAAWRDRPGMYCITGFPEEDIVKIGFAGRSLGKRLADYELAWIHLPIVIHGLMALPSAPIAEKEETAFHNQMRMGEGTPFAGRWRTAGSRLPNGGSTEWYRWSKDRERIRAKFETIRDRHKDAGAFLSWAPGKVSVLPSAKAVADVDRIVDEKVDPVHGTMYQCTWKKGREKSWLTFEFFGTEGRAHALQIWEARKKGGLKGAEAKKRELARTPEESFEAKRAVAAAEAARQKKASATVRAAVRDRAWGLLKLARAKGESDAKYPTGAMWRRARG